ncbi:MAG: pantetheine-phosphate adenylyltransferase [Atopobiaceae bacterium]|jgi:pantetheine-phosphate adenylyltransferase|nr:pantetheine-phosphate adenylyltransferase [Atopobiaceae bacterium]
MSERRTIERAVVPGTFDPITYGHIDVIRRALLFCPQVTVGVAASLGKHGTGPAFSLEERVEMAKEALEACDVREGVEVVPFNSLLVDFCHRVGAGAVVKGLRAMTDFEYELQQADLNCRMAPDVESIFVMSSPEYGYVSSSIVRELASFGGDVDLLVPPCVARHLATRYPQK